MQAQDIGYTTMKSSTTSVRPPLLLMTLLLVCAVLAGCDEGQNGVNTGGEREIGSEVRPVFYVCPMNDVPPLPAPGNCPVCGMQLMRMEDEAGTRGAPTRIRLSPEALQAASVQVAPVERRFISAEVRLFGSIEYDPGYFTRLDAFTNGVIDKVYVRRTGDFIRPNQKLFDFYSSEIYALELELLGIASRIPTYIAGQLGGTASSKLGRVMESNRHPALQGWPGRMGNTRQQAAPRPSALPLEPKAAEAVAPTQETAGSDPHAILELQRRFAAIRFRLRSWGLYDEDINEILRLERPVGIIPVRIPTLTSTVGGVLVENNAYQGRYVNTGTPLMTIADPHFVWARLRAFESDYMWLRTGQEVKFTTEARPGEIFQGKIVQLSPVFDPQTRTFEVGVVYFDKGNKLRPSMLVRAKAKARLDKDGRPAGDEAPQDRAPLIIPASAPLVTGKRAVVYVASRQEPGVYEGRLVTLGPRTAEHYVVKSGLAEGELVVVEGAFKLDSELQLRGRPSMLNPEGMPDRPAAMEHDADPLRSILDKSETEGSSGHMAGESQVPLSAVEPAGEPAEPYVESRPDTPGLPDGARVEPGPAYPDEPGSSPPDAQPGIDGLDTLPPTSPIKLDAAPALEGTGMEPLPDTTPGESVSRETGGPQPGATGSVIVPAHIPPASSGMEPNDAGDDPGQSLDEGKQDAAPMGDPSTWQFPTFPKLGRS